MSKYIVGQAVTVQHRRSGRIIPGVVSDVLPEILNGQQQYRVDIGGAHMQVGEDQVREV
jgi:hypothetical protein